MFVEVQVPSVPAELKVLEIELDGDLWLGCPPGHTTSRCAFIRQEPALGSQPAAERHVRSQPPTSGRVESTMVIATSFSQVEGYQPRLGKETA